MSRRRVRCLLASLTLLLVPVLPAARSGRATLLTVGTPLSPPAWALLERQLLDADSRACEFIAEKYLEANQPTLTHPWNRD